MLIEVTEEQLKKALATAGKIKEEARTLTICPACKAKIYRKTRLIALTPGGTYWTCFDCKEISLAVSWAAGGSLERIQREQQEEDTLVEGELL